MRKSRYVTTNLVVTVMVYRPCNKVSRPIDHHCYGLYLQCTYFKEVDGHPGNVAAGKHDDNGDKDGGNLAIPFLPCLDGTFSAGLGNNMVNVSI